MTETDPFITPREHARLRKCCERKLAYERAEGRGPAFIRDGKKILYRRTDVEAFLDANRRPAGQRDPPRALTNPTPQRDPRNRSVARKAARKSREVAL